MARKLSTDIEIDAFIGRVLTEANHHGANVNKIIQLLSDEVRKYLNLGTDKVEVYERKGNLARTCWVTLGKNRYVFSYNYESAKIELRDKTLQGKKIFDFDNNTDYKDIVKQVQCLM